MIGYVTLFAVAASAALGTAAVARRPLRLPHISFAAGMLGFTLEAAAGYGLLFHSVSVSAHARWLLALRTVALLLPLPWAVFAFVSARRPDAAIPRAWRLSFVAGGATLAAVAAAGLHWPFLASAWPRGPLPYALLTPAGQIGIAVEILATIAVLYGLEPSIRNSYGSARWQLKYLALGLGGIFVVRFYLLSQLLLFRMLTPDSLAIGSMTLALGLGFVAVGLARTGALRTGLAVSRHFVYRSVVVGICGAYLILAGAGGWLLNTLGIPDQAFWGTLVLFVSVMGLAALLLSESLRWRLRRYISTHFYADKYDYRQQWRSFTQSLASRVTVDGIAGSLLRSLMDTVGTTRAALYLAEESGGPMRQAAALGTDRLPKELSFRLEDFSDRPGSPEARLAATLGGGRPEALLPVGIAVAVPLPSQGRLLGVILVGSERTEASYGQEDLDLLTTVGEQAASAIATARLSEQLGQSRAFDAFNRLSSFIVHDLKNSISALSLLNQNARAHLDDPEFQRDALGTLERTVGRMQKLLGRLASRQAGEPLAMEEIQLPPVAEETAEVALSGSRARPKLLLEPVPAVRADADAIQRVIQNLITNAVEAMDGEGEITLRTFARDGFVGCSVTDAGCGMSEEFIRKSLFVPFQSTKKGGWGIGLYQAREILAAHGGRIEVASQEGHGTTVTLLLPEARP
ncbi:MAG: GAF domain-containing protein [Candidatus Rokubacteria bacterium]|nr:GAF domain-containing protein [Candidatus Rokubacteria bacterium]